MQESVKIYRDLAKAHADIDELLERQDKEFWAAQEQLKIATNEAALHQYGLQIGDIVSMITERDIKLQIISFQAIPSEIKDIQIYNIFARTTIYNPNMPSNYYPKIDYLCQSLIKITSK